MGDFNTHNSASSSQSGSDHAVTRGTTINNQIYGSNLTLVNENTPTWSDSRWFEVLPWPYNSHPSPINGFNLELSNHTQYPKIGSLVSGSFHRPKTYLKNIRKVRWPNNTAVTELKFARQPLPTPCSAGEERFRDIYQAAAKHHIPTGYVPDRFEKLPDEAKHLIRERDRLRTLNPSRPHIPQLNDQLAERNAISNREKWKTAVE